MVIKITTEVKDAIKEIVGYLFKEEVKSLSEWFSEISEEVEEQFEEAYDGDDWEAIYQLCKDNDVEHIWVSVWELWKFHEQLGEENADL
jgi:hypothetical protein